MPILLPLRNFLRARRALAPFVLIDLNGAVTELPPPTSGGLWAKLAMRSGLLVESALSVQGLRASFERLAGDARVRGVVLRIACEASGAVYQSLYAEIMRFRATGRRVIAYAESFGPFQYYLACACDEILMPPSADWSVIGLASDYTFFKDALDRIGVGVDVVERVAVQERRRRVVAHRFQR